MQGGDFVVFRISRAGIAEERSRVEYVIFQMIVRLPVQAIGSRARDGLDLRPRFTPLGNVVPARIDTQFLHEFRSRSRQPLPDRVVYRTAGLHAVVFLESLARIIREPAG